MDGYHGEIGHGNNVGDDSCYIVFLFIDDGTMDEKAGSMYGIKVLGSRGIISLCCWLFE